MSPASDQTISEGKPKAIVLAREEARRLGHNFVGTEQLLLGLIGEEGIASEALKAMGLSLKIARIEVEKIIGSRAGSNPLPTKIPVFTPRARRTLAYARLEAKKLGSENIEGEHVLLGLIREANESLSATQQGVASQVLQNFDIDLKVLRAKVLSISEPE